MQTDTQYTDAQYTDAQYTDTQFLSPPTVNKWYRAAVFIWESFVLISCIFVFGTHILIEPQIKSTYWLGYVHTLNTIIDVIAAILAIHGTLSYTVDTLQYVVVLHLINSGIRINFLIFLYGYGFIMIGIKMSFHLTNALHYGILFSAIVDLVIAKIEHDLYLEIYERQKWMTEHPDFISFTMVRYPQMYGYPIQESYTMGVPRVIYSPSRVNPINRPLQRAQIPDFDTIHADTPFIDTPGIIAPSVDRPSSNTLVKDDNTHDGPKMTPDTPFVETPTLRSKDSTDTEDSKDGDEKVNFSSND